MKPENNLQKNVGISIGVVILLVVFFLTIFSGKKPSNVSTAYQAAQASAAQIPSAKTSSPAAAIPSYTLAQVASHSNSASCWSIVNMSVYDLTTWINSHPGGSRAILSMCGKDSTSAFMAQHGGQSRPENELKTFFIGNYKK